MRILCTIGCVYQMFNLNVIYFSYETITNVRYETQRETYLPAITICYEKLDQFSDNILGKFNGTFWQVMQNLRNLLTVRILVPSLN